MVWSIGGVWCLTRRMEKFKPRASEEVDEQGGLQPWLKGHNGTQFTFAIPSLPSIESITCFSTVQPFLARFSTNEYY